MCNHKEKCDFGPFETYVQRHCIHGSLASSLVPDELSDLRPGRYTATERAQDTHWIEGCGRRSTSSRADVII
jgi:hypothetical protein